MSARLEITDENGDRTHIDIRPNVAKFMIELEKVWPATGAFADCDIWSLINRYDLEEEFGNLLLLQKILIEREMERFHITVDNDCLDKIVLRCAKSHTTAFHWDVAPPSRIERWRGISYETKVKKKYKEIMKVCNRLNAQIEATNAICKNLQND